MNIGEGTYFNVNFNYEGEEFRPLIFDSYDFSNKYLISNYGRIKSLPNCKNGNRFRILRFKIIRYERIMVSLKEKGGYYNSYMHILVAKVFLPNPENLPCVMWKNNNRMDVRAENLMWSKKLRTRFEVIKMPKQKTIKINQLINTLELKSIIIDGIVTPYSIHRDGYVINSKGKKLKGYLSKGYFKVDFRFKGKRNIFRINRLVANAFVENPYNFPEVNHKDGIKINNNYMNLEWCTRDFNMKHAKNNGLMNPQKRQNHPMAKLKEEDIFNIKLKLSNNEKGSLIAQQFNVTQSAISDIKKGRTWND